MWLQRSTLLSKTSRTKQLTFAAICAALYVVLALFTIPIGMIRISLASLPIIICAMVYGPKWAFGAGFIGEFLHQLLTYGLTLTTPLWCLAPGLRGLLLGLVIIEALSSADYQTFWLYFSSISVAVFITILNTGITALDALIYGYYSYAYVFASFWIRIITGIATSAILTTIAVPISNRIITTGHG